MALVRYGHLHHPKRVPEWCTFISRWGRFNRCHFFRTRSATALSRYHIARPLKKNWSGHVGFYKSISTTNWYHQLVLLPIVPVDDIRSYFSAGRLVIGIWIGQSWPQQDYVTTILLWAFLLAGHRCIRAHIRVQREWQLKFHGLGRSQIHV